LRRHLALDRLDLARSFDSAAVKLSIDTGHAHNAHCDQGAVPVDYFVVAAGEWLAHVHLQDTDGFADRHWAPGAARSTGGACSRRSPPPPPIRIWCWSCATATTSPRQWPIWSANGLAC
jgi:hypothetical protein